MTKKQYIRLKVILAEEGKTNLWLAKEIGINKTTVSKWCTNEVYPSMESLFKIANALNVDVRDLVVSNKLDIKD